MNVKRMAELTAQMQRRWAEYYEEWLAARRGRGPLDRDTARRILIEQYRRIRTPEPSVLFFESPLQCLLAAWALSFPRCSWGSLENHLATVSPQLPKFWGPIPGLLEKQVTGEALAEAQFRTPLGIGLYKALVYQAEQLVTYLWLHVRCQLGARFTTQVRREVDFATEAGERFWRDPWAERDLDKPLTMLGRSWDYPLDGAVNYVDAYFRKMLRGTSLFVQNYFVNGGWSVRETLHTFLVKELGVGASQ
jgi:hypothetical protein